MKRILYVALMLFIALLLSCFVTAENPSEWAVNEVQSAVSTGFVPEELQSGYTNPITRKEFSKLAVMFTANELGYTYDEFKAYMADKSAGYVYSDCDDEYVLLAAEAGFVYGTGDGLFEPDRAITREEAATLLNRVYFSYGDNSYYFGADFEDKAEISEWSMSGVAWCVKMGVMKGVSDTHFDPKGTYTVEQAIVTFARLAEKDEWQRYNSSARIRQKLTMDIVVSDIISSPIRHFKKSFDTPYGTVLFMSQGGAMHVQSRNVIMLVYEENGEFKTAEFGMYVPRYNEYGGFPPFMDVALSEDKSKISFKVVYDDEQYLSDGTLLHKAGVYTFVIDLVTHDITCDVSMPENLNLEKAVLDFSSADHIYVIDRIDCTSGAVLYWHTAGVPHAPSYALTLITNDGEEKDLTVPVPPATGWYSKPALENIVLSDDGTKLTFDVSFAQRAVTQMAGEKVLHEAGTYYFEADLEKGECVLKEFVPVKE